MKGRINMTPEDQKLIKESYQLAKDNNPQVDTILTENRSSLFYLELLKETVKGFAEGGHDTKVKALYEKNITLHQHLILPTVVGYASRGNYIQVETILTKNHSYHYYFDLLKGIVQAFARGGHDEAVKTLHEKNRRYYEQLISPIAIAYASRGDFQQVEYYLTKLSANPFYKFVPLEVITAYAQGGYNEAANKLIATMPKDQYECFNAAIHGYGHAGNILQIEAILALAQQTNCKNYGSLLACSARYFAIQGCFKRINTLLAQQTDAKICEDIREYAKQGFETGGYIGNDKRNILLLISFLDDIELRKCIIAKAKAKNKQLDGNTLLSKASAFKNLNQLQHLDYSEVKEYFSLTKTQITWLLQVSRSMTYCDEYQENAARLPAELFIHITSYILNNKSSKDSAKMIDTVYKWRYPDAFFKNKTCLNSEKENSPINAQPHDVQSMELG